MNRWFKRSFAKTDILIGGMTGTLVSLWLGRVLIQPNWTGVRYGVVLAALWLLASAFLSGLSAAVLRPAMRCLTRRQQWVVLLICLVLGFLFLSYWQPPLPNLLVLTNYIKVTALVENNPDSSGSEVQLQAFKVDNQFASYQTFTLSGDWQRVDQSLVAPAARPASFLWQGSGYEVRLVFKPSPRGGRVQVDWGDSTQIYDLYSLQDRPLEVVHLNQPLITRAFNLLTYLLLAGFLVFVFACPVILTWDSGGWKETPPAAAGRNVLWSTAAGLFGGVYLLLLTHQFGAWVYTDSTNYISAARHLAGGTGYIALSTGPYVSWPPLYPALLSLFESLPFGNPLELARWLNIFLFALTIGGGFYLAAELTALRSPWMMALVALVLVTSRSLVETYTYLLSEPLFLAALIFYFVFLLRFLRQGRAIDALGLTLCTALHVLSRYVGVILIGVGVLAALFLLPGGLKQRLRCALSYAAATSFLTGLWLVRNLLEARTLTGPRVAPQTSLWVTLQQAGDMLADWFNLGPGYLVFMILLAAALAAWYLWRGLRQEENVVRKKAALALVLYLFIYPAFMVPTFSVLDITPVENRYLSPIFIPLVVLLLIMLERLRQQIDHRRISRLLPLVWLLALLPALSMAVDLFNTPVQASSKNFSIYAFQDSPLVRALKQTTLPDLPLYSNCQRCLYIYDNIQPAAIFDEDPKDKVFMPASSQDFPAILVWFKDVKPANMNLPPPRPLPDIPGLLGVAVQVRPLLDTADGGVYQLLTKP